MGLFWISEAGHLHFRSRKQPHLCIALLCGSWVTCERDSPKDLFPFISQIPWSLPIAVLLHLDRPSLLPSESLYRITSSHYVLGFYWRFLKAMAVREHSALCVNLPWKLCPLCCVLSLRAGPPEKLAWSSVLRNFLSPSVHRLASQNQIDSWLCVSAARSWLEQDLIVSCDSFWDKTSHRFFTV